MYAISSAQNAALAIAGSQVGDVQDVPRYSMVPEVNISRRHVRLWEG